MASPRLSQPRAWRQGISEFFYAPEVPYGLAIVRILVCSILAIIMLQRWPFARELYSTDGAPAPIAQAYGFYDFLPVFSGEVVMLLITALIFCLVTAAIGWQTRLSLAVATVLYPYLNLLDCLSSLTKHSVIATHLLFILTLSNCGAIWSVDRWLRRRRVSPDAEQLRESELGPAWPRRLMQLLIGIIYFGAASTKLQVEGYFNGDQMQQWMMSNYNHANPAGEYLALHPWTLIVMAYLAVIWEVLFLFCAWQGWGRVWMLGLGVCFHIGTGFSLGLIIFPCVMISSYFCFLNESDVVRWKAWLQSSRWNGLFAERRQRQTVGVAELAAVNSTGFQFTSVGVFCFAMVMLSAVGVAAEHWLDPYNKRSESGPQQLVELTTAEIERLRQHDVPIQDFDKLLSFDVGGQLFGGTLLSRRQQFQSGETLIAQCTLNPPHEDLWLDCVLVDEFDRVIAAQGKLAERAKSRATFTCRLADELPAGDYYLQLKCRGAELCRQRISVSTASGSINAN